MFSVSGAKTEEEHKNLIDGFQKEIEDNGFVCNGFGSGTFNDYENILNNNKDYLYLDISIDDVSEKEDVLNIYKEWKKKIKRG